MVDLGGGQDGPLEHAFSNSVFIIPGIIVISLSGVTNSPLCRGCIEGEETAAHVLLECRGVAHYRVRYLSSPGSVQEAIINVKAFGAFLEEEEVFFGYKLYKSIKEKEKKREEKKKAKQMKKKK